MHTKRKKEKNIMSSANDVTSLTSGLKDRQENNWKNAGKIENEHHFVRCELRRKSFNTLIKILAFLAPLFVLVCLLVFYIDVMNYFLDNDIIIKKENIFHAISALVLVIYLSWRPYKWIEYKIGRYMDEIERTKEKERKD